MYCFQVRVRVLSLYCDSTPLSFCLVNFCLNIFEDESITLQIGVIRFTLVPCWFCDVKTSNPISFCVESTSVGNSCWNG